MLILDEKHSHMLASLEGVPGYVEYHDLIINECRKKMENKKPFRAEMTEIEALYKLNKPLHPLTKITSHLKDEPESLFCLNGKEAFLEVAFIGDLAFANQEKQACLNAIHNNLRRLQLRLQDFESKIKVIVYDYRQPPTCNDYDKIKDRFDILGKENKMILMPFGMIAYIPSGDKEPHINITENGLIVYIQKAGFIDQSFKSDITSKIKRVLDQKQKQHKKRYSDHIKLFYFKIDCPNHLLDQIMCPALEHELKENEMLAICANEKPDRIVLLGSNILTSSLNL